MAELNITQKSVDSQGVLQDTNTEIKDLKELKVGAGSGVTFTDKYGTRWGSISFDTAPAWIKTDGSFKFTNSNGDVLIDSQGANGNFINIINSALNTSSKKILTGFTFESTDYAGALKTGNPAWDEATGLPTGGTGFIINAAGIIGVQDGDTTVAILADGTATFAGTLSAPSGTLGTITAGIITGATIQTAITGYRTRIGAVNGVEFLLNNTQKGIIYADLGDTLVIGTAANIQGFANATSLGVWNTDGFTLPSNKKLSFSGGGSIVDGGSYLKVQGAAGGIMDLQVKGNVYPDSDNARQCGTADKRWQDINSEDAHIDDIWIGDTIHSSQGGQGQDYTSHKYITDIYWDNNKLKCGERYLVFQDGLIVSRSGESIRTVHDFS